MKIISIANQKGGCGKTTTAINLASTLSFNGQKTLLIDLDPQAHATLGLNVNDNNSLYNCISKLTPHKLKIKDIIQKAGRSFDIVPSNVLVGTLEQELADEIGRELKLVEIIDEIKGLYDYILIDCPPSLGFLTVNAIRASDELIIPLETSRFSMQGVDHLMDIAHLIRERLGHPVGAKVLVTMFDSRLRHSFTMLGKIKEKFSGMLFDTIIHVNVKLKEAAVMGEAVIKYDKYCRGAKDYLGLAREIMTADRRPVVPETRSKPEAPARPEGYEPSQRMQELIQKETQELLKATAFCLQAPDARSVYVTGSFNDWSLDENCRMANTDGTWRLSLSLKPGTYKYQFIVDGKWQEDPANANMERNSFGDINSLIEVKA
ncbi:MAG: AAA family ATPase [Candidatus Omnitrophica bacterium]|nr:AAA family ATPase [Candidatus Omnitrophota bacterium]MDE2231475.1 AAA family ATPase [Candidatus Omnitrophota bacterium]